MNYITLARQLDILAKDTKQYNTCPDDIMNLVLEYTGDIKKESTRIYRIEIEFSYDKLNRNNGGLTKDKIGYFYKFYCSCCDKFYDKGGYVGHLHRKIHKTNHKKGDLCIDIHQKIKQMTLNRYRGSETTLNIRLKDYNFSEVWMKE